MLMLALALAPLASAVQSAEPDPVAAAYAAAGDARDEEALAGLWRAHPARILPTFDADLEGSLAAWEEDPEAAPDSVTAQRIAELEDRALWAARVASDVTGRPIFADYASSFVGWGTEEKQRFRAGQEAYGLARQALDAGELETALERARQCRALACPLGDWWGTAMGYSAEARALGSLGQLDDAATAFSLARLLYSDLGLAGSEYANLRGLAEVLVQQERFARAHTAATDALALAERLGRTDDRGALLRLRLVAEIGLGRTDEAERTTAELEELSD